MFAGAGGGVRSTETACVAEKSTVLSAPKSKIAQTVCVKLVAVGDVQSVVGVNTPEGIVEMMPPSASTVVAVAELVLMTRAVVWRVSRPSAMKVAICSLLRIVHCWFRKMRLSQFVPTRNVTVPVGVVARFAKPLEVSV